MAKNRIMRIWKTIFLLVVTSILIVGLSASYYKSRLISSIAGPTLPVFPTPTEKSIPGISNRSISTTPITTSATSESVKEKPKCNGPEILLILVVGADNDFGYFRGLADVIQIYKINFVTAKVEILSIPRDLWVAIPGLEEQEIYQGKINQAYFYGNLYRLEGGGNTLLARTLYENFGLPIDHYIAVNMVAFTKIVDELGGIDIYNPRFATDDLYSFPQGNIHLNGEDTLNYSRIRKLDGVFFRMDRQVIVVKALAKKILTPTYFIQVPSLINTFRDEIVTSLGENEFDMLLCIATKIDLQEVDNFTLGMDYAEQSWAFPSWAENGTWILVPDFEKIRGFIQDFMRYD